MMNRYAIISVLISLQAAFYTCHLQAADEDFGRLFSRPHERKNLDTLRQNQKLKVVTPQEAVPAESLAEAIPPALPDPITLQGYVKRSDGVSTVWINNKAVQEDFAVDNVQIGRLNQQAGSPHAGEGLNVRIPANGKHVRLKAGQVYMPESNQIREMKIIEKEKHLSLEETGTIRDGLTD